MITFAIAFIGYMVIGGIAEALFGDSGMDAGIMFFLWPLFLALTLTIGPLYLSYTAFKKLPEGVRWLKHHNDPPSPIAIVQGVVETTVLRHIDQWHGEGPRRVWEYKNIRIVPGSNDIGNFAYTVNISGDTLEYSDKLQKAIVKSRKMWEEKQAYKAKYEKEQRMLENLNEFMETPPPQLQVVETRPNRAGKI